MLLTIDSFPVQRNLIALRCELNIMSCRICTSDDFTTPSDYLEGLPLILLHTPGMSYSLSYQ
jgi:hypothetical protein